MLCAPLDTLDYNTFLSGLTDLKGNSSDELELLIPGSTVIDSFPPQVIASEPRNGASLPTLKPEFMIWFSEIIYSKDLEIKLVSNESNTSIGAEIITGDAEIFTLMPVTELVNYSTYTLTVNAVDPNGNALEEEIVKSFIPIVKEE